MNEQELIGREPVAYPSPAGGLMYGWLIGRSDDPTWDGGRWRNYRNGLPSRFGPILEPLFTGQAGMAVCWASREEATRALVEAEPRVRTIFDLIRGKMYPGDLSVIHPDDTHSLNTILIRQSWADGTPIEPQQLTALRELVDGRASLDTVMLPLS